jgi:hypothetical protein
MGPADEPVTTLRKPVVAAAAFDMSQSFDAVGEHEAGIPRCLAEQRILVAVVAAGSRSTALTHCGWVKCSV